MIRSLRAFLHTNSVTLVFLMMVAMFTITTTRLWSDNNRIAQLATARLEDQAYRDYHSCLQREDLKANIDALIGVILESPLVTPDRAVKYRELQSQLHPEACSAPNKENNP